MLITFWADMTREQRALCLALIEWRRVLQGMGHLSKHVPGESDGTFSAAWDRHERLVSTMPNPCNAVW